MTDSIPSLVTPAQVQAYLTQQAPETAYELVVMLPMVEVVEADLPHRANFESTPAWLSATSRAWSDAVSRSDGHWQERARYHDVEVLAASCNPYLHVRGRPQQLRAFLDEPGLEQAYSLTERDGACGASNAPYVYRLGRDEPSRLPDSARIQDAPLGLEVVETDLGRFSTFTPRNQKYFLEEDFPGHLDWCEQELAGMRGHPRHAEYLRRLADARARVAQLQAGQSA